MGAWRSLVALIVTILGISMLSSTVNGHEMHQVRTESRCSTDQTSHTLHNAIAPV